MKPRFETLGEKKFVGSRMTMSFAGNKTFALWQSFMPQRKKIQSVVGTELYSIEIYPQGFFERFNPGAEFEKWAAVEVSAFDKVSAELETIVSPEGLYAVFLYRGMAADGVKTYQFIFNDWLPGSEFELDERPHFAVMGEKYKNDDPDSEEEIWIPVKLRTTMTKQKI